MTSKGGPWGATVGPGGASAAATVNPYHHQGPNPFHQGAAPGTNSDWWHSSSSHSLVLIHYNFFFVSSPKGWTNLTDDSGFFFEFQVEVDPLHISRHPSEELGAASRRLINTTTGRIPNCPIWPPSDRLWD